jgi:hypothetical protein
MSGRKKSPASNVIPMMPAGYSPGHLPAIPPRRTFVNIELPDPDQPAPARVQPRGAAITKAAEGDPVLTFADPQVADLVIRETQQRDEIADQALVDILAAIEGQPLTPELLHRIRVRLRKLGDDVHAMTRIAWGFIHKREDGMARSKVDPVEVFRLVEEQVAAGERTGDAFYNVADSLGVAMETVRGAYYKQRNAKPR